ncbi:sacsin N-terminal ATP-binding-like domain-containing protein [Streptomyces sp. PTD5-9]|uniref:sacsin N-terminal ATP-binding-like domain-containing protein n=1 Tax=Streptomyces sp. PTD5-9 TaxID=3120150 RepID=UPI00300B55CD
MSINATEGADPFGTARLRRGVLDAWGAGPARFREDANAEEELALGGYRDRLVVELAQNAADAAARADVPGRLRLTLHPATADAPAVLAAANTGAPLDATGVESLSTLRASAKREGHEGAVGRFGVGFAAVLAVSDEPAVIGRYGGVRWSLAEARDLAADAATASPGLGDELRRRDGHVPLLRLPLPAEGAAPDGYDTVVVLPLRDGGAEDLVVRLLAAVDDALLLTLRGLDEIVIETPDTVRTLRRARRGPYTHIEDSAHGTHRWRTVTHHGPVEAALLADRPREERLRPHWAVTWAVPVDAEGAPVRPRTAPVVHAPTPTDEPLGIPALLIASLPLDTTRRHPAPGPLTDFLVQRAADAYAELLADWRPVSIDTIDLVPGPLGKGELDGALRGAILQRLPRVAFLEPATPRRSATGTDPAATAGGGGADATGAADTAADGERWDAWNAGGDGIREASAAALRPIEAEVLEGAGAETVRVLAEVLPCLLPAGVERRSELRTLGVARVPLTEAIDRLAGLERDPGWWRRLYDSLSGVDPDRLSGLPVPLAGTERARDEEVPAAPRTAIGPRQVLLPLPDGLTGPVLERLARLGLKVAHPDAVHPLLEKLGALPAGPRAVLTTPQVRAAVAGSLDEGEIWDEDALTADEITEIVLTLVRDAELAPGDEPWLGALALPDEDGEIAPAGELVLPGSPFAAIMREGELALCDQELADRWGEQPLTACGVLATFALVRATDVVLDPDELEPREGDFAEPDDAGLLDAVDVWCEDVLDRLELNLPPRGGDDEGWWSGDGRMPVPPVATELVAVRDLDLVDDDAWPQALAMLARPPLRDALTQPVRVLLPDGTTRSVRPYTAWWLRDHPVLDGRRPAGLRAASGDPRLAGLYDSVDATGFDDAQVLRALGVRTSVAALLDEPGGAAELLARLADEDRAVDPVQLHALYTALAGLDPEQVTLPDALRAVVDGGTRVVDAADAVIADAPDLLPLAAGLPLLPVAPARAADLAELLQVRRLGESVEAEVTTDGEEHRVPEAVRTLLGPGTPDTYLEHAELRAGGVELDWRRTPDGAVHAATLEGVAAGLAWAAGQWPRRFEVAALLEDPTRTGELARDRWFD